MKRVTERGDVERDRTPAGVTVKETDEVGGKLGRTADDFADQTRVGDEVRILARETPHGSPATQDVVERTRVSDHLMVQQQCRVA
jgi:hypothetical protein